MLNFSTWVAATVTGYQAGKSLLYTLGGLVKKEYTRIQPPQLITDEMIEESRQETLDIRVNGAKTLLYGYFTYTAITCPNPVNVLIAGVAIAETAHEIYEAREKRRAI